MLQWLSLAVAALAAFFYFVQRDDVAVLLPDSYALCSDAIYTVDPARPTADCLLVHSHSIAAVGSLADVQSHWDSYQAQLVATFYANEPTAKKALPVFRTPKNAVVVPGLTDAHAHLVEYGFKAQLPLDAAASLDDVLDILEQHVRANPDVLNDTAQWIQAIGWDQTRWAHWDPTAFPTASDLASRPLLKNRPIALRRIDVHALWVSPTALDIARAQLPGGDWPADDDVARNGGKIVRFDDGRPTGVFLDNAMSLVATPPPSPAQLDAALARALADAVSLGLTSVHDAAASPEYIDAFKRFADDGALPLRIYAMAAPSASASPAHLERLDNYGQHGRLTVKSVKLFTDGALGSWGAALIQPYADDPRTSGIMRTSPEALNATVTKWWDAGWAVNVHCIGDRANKVALDVFEALLVRDSRTRESGEDVTAVARARRPRIEHAQVMRAEDVGRIGRLGVIASVQPTHATSDMWYAEKRLGPERMRGAYAYRSLLEASPDKVLPLGSDFPVEPMNPLFGFYAAVARVDRAGRSPHGPGGWYPAERLTPAQALKSLTLDGAYAGFSEDTTGSLAPGKKADYVVLDRDIMVAAAAAGVGGEGRSDDDGMGTGMGEVVRAKVVATVVDGRVVFGGI